MKAERLLVAIDDSEASRRVLPYVGNIAGGCKSFRVVLCYIPGPLPPELLEFRGAENPKEEKRLDREQELKQAKLLDQRSAAAQRLLDEAKRALVGDEVAADRVETRIGEALDAHEHLVDALLEQARATDCQTIVVGRRSYSALRELLRTHVCHDLVKKGEGFTIWVVE